jgi:hypothetical protein
MKNLLVAIICFHLFVSHLQAQSQGAWVIRGDTTRAPRGCSTSMAIATINLFLGAMRDADSVRLDRALAPKFGVSIIPLVPAHPFFLARSMSDLLRYARERHGVHDRMQLEGLIFNGWHHHDLDFGPIYVLRSADDLGRSPRRAIGKGKYHCNDGISVLNLGRPPDNDPGPERIGIVHRRSR